MVCCYCCHAAVDVVVLVVAVVVVVLLLLVLVVVRVVDAVDAVVAVVAIAILAQGSRLKHKRRVKDLCVFAVPDLFLLHSHGGASIMLSQQSSTSTSCFCQA